MSGLTPHVAVTATVTRPWGETSEHYVGTYPTWALPLDAAWKRARRALILSDECYHASMPGDGWRLSWRTEPLDDCHD